eukprot:COSAG01_NODE_7761_length_3067_cov_2.317049_4_plen_80_part_00
MSLAATLEDSHSRLRYHPYTALHCSPAATFQLVLMKPGLYNIRLVYTFGCQGVSRSYRRVLESRQRIASLHPEIVRPFI